MKKSLLLLSLILSVCHAIAQEYMDRNMTITENISMVSLGDGEMIAVNPQTNKATIEVVNFGGYGNTVFLRLYMPEALAEIKDSGTNIDALVKDHFEYSWSGKDIHLVKHTENNQIVFCVMRGTTTLCATLAKTNTSKGLIWSAMIDSSKSSGTVDDLHVGMNRFAVEKISKELGLSRFEFARNDGNLKVYALKWLNMEQKRHGLGREDYHYQVNNDLVYGEFWFDTNDNLVKWLLR